ncbi:MAG TPA: bifunctional demethylmenaquinone methyltransferase/2-methoxy-6-polyprenyl-1,4-benzoquinol methylase UbiE [Terriglobales bacterium]|jgi:demethylmenaquinone methyltransferase/2-methoxy-6-polyprenyl-1,4-benzoquinol methylase|nr:bifunctional demethylmenaquinone methyltransferase/2-methoxy-6-polyprenyl-1,4-benzoquinol methylase UbiE [Terriglobales bacterium]
MMSTETAKTEAVVGASPAGAGDQNAASQAVREMFTAIAPRYDLLNHVLSCNVDRLWWWRTARTFRHILRRPQAQVLDLCCGTGDMTLALARRAGEQRTAAIIAADFSHAMLQRATKKTQARNIQLIEADALHLPLADARFDLVVSAFGFRNLANYDAGLEEILRVLKPEGEIGILDFSEPKGVLGKIYGVYFRRVLPVVGGMISGVRGPYAYLPASVERFPEPEEMLKRMRAIGFRDAEWKPYSFGIAGLFRAKK